MASYEYRFMGKSFVGEPMKFAQAVMKYDEELCSRYENETEFKRNNPEKKILWRDLARKMTRQLSKEGWDISIVEYGMEEQTAKIDAVAAKIEEDDSILDGTCDLCGENATMMDANTDDLDDLVRLCSAHLDEHMDQLDVVIAKIRASRNGVTLALPPDVVGDSEEDPDSVRGEWDHKAQKYEQDEPDFFDPKDDEDGRERRDRSIVYRRGQPQFRSDLMEAYGKRCAITDCDVVEALEACHIRPYNGDKTNHVTNGLLLRSDLHTLFDKKLIAIHEESGRVLIAESLENTTYEDLSTKRIEWPAKGLRPCKDALKMHREEAEL